MLDLTQLEDGCRESENKNTLKNMKTIAIVSFFALGVVSCVNSRAEAPLTLGDYAAAKMLKQKVMENKRSKEKKFPHFVFRHGDKYSVFLGSRVDDVPAEREVGLLLGIYAEEIKKLGLHGEFRFSLSTKTVEEKKICTMVF